MSWWRWWWWWWWWPWGIHLIFLAVTNLSLKFTRCYPRKFFYLQRSNGIKSTCIFCMIIWNTAAGHSSFKWKSLYYVLFLYTTQQKKMHWSVCSLKGGKIDIWDAWGSEKQANPKIILRTTAVSESIGKGTFPADQCSITKQLCHDLDHGDIFQNVHEQEKETFNMSSAYCILEQQRIYKRTRSARYSFSVLNHYVFNFQITRILKWYTFIL